MIYSKHERVCTRDLSNLTLQIILDASGAWTNVSSKLPIVLDDYTHAPLCQSYLHCGIDETGSISIKYILCHQVLSHPSEVWMSWMGKHLLTNAYTGKLNELREAVVKQLTRSLFDETAFGIFNRQWSQQTTIVSLHSQIFFDIQVILYWLKWQTKHPKLAAKNVEISHFHQDTSSCYLMLGYLSA